MSIRKEQSIELVNVKPDKQKEITYWVVFLFLARLLTIKILQIILYLSVRRYNKCTI